MTDSTAQNADAQASGDSGGPDATSESYSAARALLGFFAMLLVVASALALVVYFDMGSEGDAILVSAFVLTLAISPLVFRAVGRRDIATALLRWHVTWMLLVAVLGTLYVLSGAGNSLQFATGDPTVLPDIEFLLRDFQDNLQRLEFMMRAGIVSETDFAGSEIARLFAQLEELIYLVDRYATAPRGVFQSTTTAAGQFVTILLLGLVALKVLQAILAGIPRTRAWLTPAPGGPVPRGPDPIAALSAERRWLVENLMRRASQMRTRAVVVLLAIIALILGGIVSIYMAGDLVSSDAQQTTRLTQLTGIIDGYKSEVADAQEALTETEVSLAEAVTKLRRLRRTLGGFGEDTPDLDAALVKAGVEIQPLAPLVLAKAPPDPARDASQADTEGGSGGASASGGVTALGADGESAADEATTVTTVSTSGTATGSDEAGEAKPAAGAHEEQEPRVLISEVDTRRVETLKSFAELTQKRALLSEDLETANAMRLALEKQLADDVDTYLVDSQPEKTDLALLVASGATRFGILIVVIFLVQILVGIYRYSLRLAAFYAARADALIAVRDRKTGLGDWGPEFLPEMIDFGRNPVTPAQYIVDVMRAYFDRKGGKTEKAGAAPGAGSAGG